MGWFSDRAARARRGWWHRNWWGLAAVPLFAVAVLVSPNDSYQTWRTAEPREVVEPSDEGWARYGEIAVRLLALERVDEQLTLGDEPFPLAPGLRAWRARLAITPPADPEAVVSCEVELEDGAGRVFGEGPNELDRAQGPDGFSLELFSCTSLDEEEAADGVFETVAYFVMPRSAEPAAVRVISRLELPAYVRFAVGGATPVD